MRYSKKRSLMWIVSSKQHDISVNLSDDLLMAKMDVRLIVQVIINIVNNAIKYTPVGSHIDFQQRSRMTWCVSAFQMMDREFPVKLRNICLICFTPRGLGNQIIEGGLALALAFVNPLLTRMVGR